jgi:hypothetical protein
MPAADHDDVVRRESLVHGRGMYGPGQGLSRFHVKHLEPSSKRSAPPTQVYRGSANPARRLQLKIGAKELDHCTSARDTKKDCHL